MSSLSGPLGSPAAWILGDKGNGPRELDERINARRNGIDESRRSSVKNPHPG
jgi:hypothetical protein